MAQTKPTIDTVWGSTGSTTDPGNTKMNTGWTAEIPTHDVQNFWQQRADEMLTHLNEQGVAVWDNTTTYPIDAWAKGSNGTVYKALQEATAQDPTSSPAFWSASLSGVTAENLIINPRMSINQRVFAGGALADGDYGYDRWVSAHGATTITKAGNVATLTGGVVKQIVETDGPISGRSVTASLESATGDFVLAILDDAGSVLASSTLGSVTHTLGSDEATLSLQVTNTSGSVTWQSAKLEWGNAATTHLDRLIGAELVLCQRYYQFFEVEMILQSSRRATAENLIDLTLTFPTSMRAAPSMVVGTQTGSFTSLGINNLSTDAVQWTAISTSQNSTPSIADVSADSEL